MEENYELQGDIQLVTKKKSNVRFGPGRLRVTQDRSSGVWSCAWSSSKGSNKGYGKSKVQLTDNIESVNLGTVIDSADKLTCEELRNAKGITTLRRVIELSIKNAVDVESISVTTSPGVNLEPVMVKKLLDSIKSGSVEQPSDFVKECAFPDALCVTGMKRLRDMWMQGKLTDYMLITREGTQFRVHRTHLACVSDYIYGMLSADMLEKETDRVTLPVVTANGLRHILEFVYGGKMKICLENLKDIIEAARYLQIHCVLLECCLYISQTLVRDTCLKYAELVDLYDLELSDETTETMETLISNHTHHFVSTGEHLMIPRENLVLYLQGYYDDEYISETQLYGRAMEWLKASEERLEDAAEILAEIKFKLMTEKELQRIHDEILKLTSDERILDMITSAQDYVRADAITKMAIKAEDTEIRGQPSVILFSGHTDDGHVSKSFYALNEDGSNPTWIQFPDIPYEFIQASVASWNGYVFVCGGWKCWPSSGDTTSACYVFDPRSWRWSAFAPMMKGRVDFPLVPHGDKLYALGGLLQRYKRRDMGFDEMNSCVDEFDPKSNSWSVSGVMDIPVAGHKAVSHKKHIYIYGGVDSKGSPLKVFKSYDISSSTWTELTPESPLRSSCSAWWILSSQKELVVRTYNPSQQTILKEFEKTEISTSEQSFRLVAPTPPLLYAPPKQGSLFGGQKQNSGFGYSGQSGFGIPAQSSPPPINAVSRSSSDDVENKPRFIFDCGTTHPQFVAQVDKRVYFGVQNPKTDQVRYAFYLMQWGQTDDKAISLPDAFTKHPDVQNPLCCAVALPRDVGRFSL